MKYKLMKKAAADMLSAAMAVSVLPYAGRMDVSAKASFVKLHTAFKTLTVGQTYKLKLKNNALGWKVTKAASKDSNVCKAVNKKTYVKLAAKSEGRTTIRVTLKTAKRKGANATKRLTCRVNVKPLDTMEEPDAPVAPQEPETRTDVTVGTQAELNEALANQGYTKITLQTKESGLFTIPAGEHASVDFTVNAPNADVENHAVFRSVTVQDIKENTWKEYAKGNLLKILDEKASLVIDAAASVKEITYAGTGVSTALKLDIHGTVERVAFQTSVKASVMVAETASVADIRCSAQKTEVQLNAKGAVGSVSLEADAALDLTGSPKKEIAVMVAETAKGAQVKSSVKVAITVKAEISILLEKGAEGSSIQVAVKEITASITNKTGAAVELKQPDNTVRKIAVNTTVSVKNGQAVTQGTGSSSGTTYVPSTGSSGGSSSGGSKIPTIDTSKITGSLTGSLIVTGTALSPIENGVIIIDDPEYGLLSCGVITQSSLMFHVKVPEKIEIDQHEEDKTGLSVYPSGMDMPSSLIIEWERHVKSLDGKPVDQDIQIYFRITLKKEKWQSAGSVITGEDWDITNLTKEEFDKLYN